VNQESCVVVDNAAGHPFRAAGVSFRSPVRPEFVGLVLIRMMDGWLRLFSRC